MLASTKRDTEGEQQRSRSSSCRFVHGAPPQILA
jgi:hypothetical protein